MTGRPEARPDWNRLVSALSFGQMLRRPVLIAAAVIFAAAVGRQALVHGAEVVPLMLGGVALCVLVIYGYFWLFARNARLYFADGKLITRDALGRTKSVPAQAVDRLERLSVVSESGMGTKLIVARGPDSRVLLSLGAGDTFQPAAVEAVARAAGVRLIGDFTSTVHLDQWTRIPGAADRVTRGASALSSRPWLPGLLGAGCAVLIALAVVVFLIIRSSLR